MYILHFLTLHRHTTSLAAPAIRQMHKRGLLQCSSEGLKRALT